MRGSGVDVARSRERTRRRRLWKLFVWLAPVGVYFYYRIAHVEPDPVRVARASRRAQMEIFLPLGLIALLGVVHRRADDVGRASRRTCATTRARSTSRWTTSSASARCANEVVNTLNLFLGYQTFREHMGGNPRKAILFEGPPGTGKTYMAKAMAREAGVPYLFVSSTAFQSMYYGQTGRKIRNYFKELRKAAREEGGAIGFIEEIDAIAGARSGMRSDAVRRRVAPVRARRAQHVERRHLGCRQRAADPAAVVRRADRRRTHAARGSIDWANRWLPAHRRFKKKPPVPSNILVIGATNRAADLDPALLRPGRFDRSIHFDVPTRSGRREIIDYYLDARRTCPSSTRKSGATCSRR